MLKIFIIIYRLLIMKRPITKNNRKIFCSMIFLLFTAAYLPSNAQFWQKLDTANHSILNIYTPKSNPDYLVVSSNTYEVDIRAEAPKFFFVGSGFKYSTDRGQNWSETRLDSFSVMSIIEDPKNPEVWFASVYKAKRGYMLKSTDKGETWNIDDTYCNELHQIYDLESRSAGDGYIYGAASNTSDGFIVSTDGFETCSNGTGLNIQSRDVAVPTYDDKTVYLAGDNIFDGGVFRSHDNGQTWIRGSEGIEGLRILCVMPSSRSPRVILCGADSLDRERNSIPKGIYRSMDSGMTWELAAAEGAFVYQIKEHPTNPKYLVAACGEDGIWGSANTGFYWEKFDDGLPDGAFCTHVEIPNWEPTDEGILAYAGVQGGGVYISGRIITSIEENIVNSNKLDIKSVSPTPFSDKFTLTFSIPEAQNVTFEMFDMMGNKIFFKANYYNAGDHNFVWFDNQNISSGNYILKVSNGLKTEIVKLNKVR